MDELVTLVVQKTGLSPEQARSAAETVLGFLKTKLPEPIAGQIDTFVSGSDTGSSGSVTQSLGDIAKGVIGFSDE
ncbi:MAG: DUF2267 domain-containing protein [Isosphaeraceae bacterium]